MRQMIKIFILLICLTIISNPTYSEEIKGNIEYKIPIDYAKMSTEELENKADFYYHLAIKTSNGNLNEEMTSALNLYAILANKHPEKTIYRVKLGTLYDILGKDRYAKGCFYNSIGIDKRQPETYFRLGEFYHKRAMYKKALKVYKEGYKYGYQNHYETLYKIGDIYEKFGDTEAALKYLKLASEQSPNSDLDNRIKRVENANQINNEYYSDTRIRQIERENPPID